MGRQTAIQKLDRVIEILYKVKAMRPDDEVVQDILHKVIVHKNELICEEGIEHDIADRD